MAIVNMTRVATATGEREEQTWEYVDTIAAPGNGDSVLVPAGVNQITISLIPTAGSGKVQITTDTKNEVETGTPSWIDWPGGVVTVPTSDTAQPITAFRQVNVSGSTKMTARAQ